ncbi:hypothetical protein [Pseudoalteromonas sp. McH1-42]|uniref:hypothetical protein n=1 Tax=Pseudoalteromonas sp. McH1-42 TaxID=2917752 RepID=UPI001EF50F69|nr:hypothetical protein [Pseudoalteromonas sp. McH1-42]MCG7560715.1 hypothetical protein [Pseudoalteromonas sp. McH1-42]
MFAEPINSASRAYLGEVKIVNDVVYFQALLPDIASVGCANTGAPFHWAFSLSSAEGPSLYRAILAAQSGNVQLAVTPAGDCAAASGVARPAAITLLKPKQ